MVGDAVDEEDVAGEDVEVKDFLTFFYEFVGFEEDVAVDFGEIAVGEGGEEEVAEVFEFWEEGFVNDVFDSEVEGEGEGGWGVIDEEGVFTFWSGDDEPFDAFDLFGLDAAVEGRDGNQDFACCWGGEGVVGGAEGEEVEDARGNGRLRGV